MTNHADTSNAFVDAVAQCGANGAFLDALSDLYHALDDELAVAGTRCLGGGVCCKFDLAGHRLYLTAGEMALLLKIPPPAPHRAAGRRCSWQVGPRCMARNNRPLGCRIYFCRCTETNHDEMFYERYHRRVANLHQRLCLPYAYAELTASAMQFQIPKEVM